MTSNSGKYVIFAEYYGSELYTSRRSKLLFLEGINPHLKITLDPINSLTYGESNLIKAVVKTQSNTAVTGKPVKFTIQAPDGTITTMWGNTNSYGTVSKYYTPSMRGEHRILAETAEDDNYSRSSSEELYVLTDSLDTSVVLSANVGEVVIDNKLQLKAVVSENNNKLQGLTVQFYGGETRVGQGVTNSNGECTVNPVINSIGSVNYHAVVLPSNNYNTSSSNTVSVTGVKHTVDLSMYSTIIYKGWNPLIKVLDDNGNNISGVAFTVTMNGNSSTVTSDSGGILTLPAVNTVGSINIQIRLSGHSTINNVNTTLSVTVKDTVKTSNISLTAVNVNTGLPYKAWEQLGNIRANDTNYVICGANCSSNMLAGRNGSRHTPASLKFSNMGLNIPTGSVIESIRVNMSIRTLSCSSDSANIGISAPTLNMFGQSVTMVLPGNTGRLPFKLFDTVTCNINPANINASQLNNSNNGFTISFPQNSTTNPGKLQINYVEIVVNYRPSQEG